MKPSKSIFNKLLEADDFHIGEAFSRVVCGYGKLFFLVEYICCRFAQDPNCSTEDLETFSVFRRLFLIDLTVLDVLLWIQSS